MKSVAEFTGDSWAWSCHLFKPLPGSLCSPQTLDVRTLVKSLSNEAILLKWGIFDWMEEQLIQFLLRWVITIDPGSMKMSHSQWLIQNIWEQVVNVRQISTISSQTETNKVLIGKLQGEFLVPMSIFVFMEKSRNKLKKISCCRLQTLVLKQ